MTAARIQRWAIFLSAYNYTVKYRSGSENSNVDFCSRFLSNEKGQFSSVKKQVFRTELIHAPVTSKEIREFSKRDLIISNVIDFALFGCDLPKQMNKSNHIFVVETN